MSNNIDCYFDQNMNENSISTCIIQIDDETWHWDDDKTTTIKKWKFSVQMRKAKEKKNRK